MKSRANHKLHKCSSAPSPIIMMIAFDDYPNQDDAKTVLSLPPSSCKNKQDNDSNDNTVDKH
jgi:hypothetical protein